MSERGALTRVNLRRRAADKGGQIKTTCLRAVTSCHTSVYARQRGRRLSHVAGEKNLRIRVFPRVICVLM